MTKLKKLAEAEWEIMDGVWHFSKAVTVREIHAHLYPKGEKAYTTVQTFLNILVDKGLLEREKIGMVNFYSPLFSRTTFAKRETQTLVSRIFEGSFGELAQYLVKTGKLSMDELSALKTLIETKESEKRRRKKP
jgi:predicted transcriptional regulator